MADRVQIGLWQLDLRARKCVEALRKNGFDAHFLPDQEAVRDRILAECDPADSIGFGGSMSVAGLEIFGALSGRGKKLYDHSRVPPEERAATRLAQLTCDLFLTGTNAVTLEGCLVNLDMTGNRTNAMTFGPKKIIVVAGGQKIVTDLPEAIRRIKTVSAPRNAKRLKLSTPCAATGFCEDCNSPQRICRVYSIIERRPVNSDITVLVCGEPLGL
jgi:hypothetical protein